MTTAYTDTTRATAKQIDTPSAASPANDLNFLPNTSEPVVRFETLCSFVGVLRQRCGIHNAIAVAVALSVSTAVAADVDFTRVCMNGSLDCAGAADTTGRPAFANAWACIKDNSTNLVWSLHSGLGDRKTYAQTSLPAEHSDQGRCGYSSGWRVPTRQELQSLIGSEPRHFPATQVNWYWTRDSHPSDPSLAGMVRFHDGYSLFDSEMEPHFVRLVRSIQ